MEIECKFEIPRCGIEFFSERINPIHCVSSFLLKLQLPVNLFCLLIADRIKKIAKVDKSEQRARVQKQAESRWSGEVGDIHKFYEAPRRREDEYACNNKGFVCVRAR